MHRWSKEKSEVGAPEMKSYARNISTLAKTTSILADVTASDDVECTRPTLESYIEALEKLFVIQDIEAW